jgi:hypothetical protein
MEITMYLFVAEIKTQKSKIMKAVLLFACILTATFSIFGFVANGINFTTISQNNQFDEVLNPEYQIYKDKKERLENDIKNIKIEINNFPSQEEFLKDVPSWENKENLIINYMENKNKLIEEKKILKNQINTLIIPEKTKKVKVENSGINETILIISRRLGINSKTIIIFFFLVLGLSLQFFIVVTRILSSRTPVKNTHRNKWKLRNPVKSNVLELKNPRTSAKSNSNISNGFDFNIVIRYLSESYNYNDIIKKFQDKFNLSEYEYKKIRQKLKDKDIIEIKNKRMYYKGGETIGKRGIN